jgi:aryl-alcohol dehydrogenase-like predicted oxidoreductase
MEYAILGNTGMRVSRVVLGTATFGIAPLEGEAPALVDRALELGINFFNTATHYGNRKRWDRPGVPPAEQRKSSEEILGNALKGHRNDVIIATKVGMDVGDGVNDGGGPKGGGLSRYHIMQRVEMSLRRLQTDHIDVYYAQTPDRITPLEDTLRAFDDLVRQGKVRYFGLSNHAGWKMVEAMWACQRLGLNMPIGQEVQYSLVRRESEHDVIPVSLEFGQTITAFSALGGGLLTGMDTLQHRSIATLGGQRWRLGEGPGFSAEELTAAEKLDALSKEWEVSAAQLALAWLLTRPAVTSALVGPETMAELEENAAAADVSLSSDQVEALDALWPG